MTERTPDEIFAEREGHQQAMPRSDTPGWAAAMAEHAERDADLLDELCQAVCQDLDQDVPGWALWALGYAVSGRRANAQEWRRHVDRVACQQRAAEDGAEAGL